MYQNSPVPTEIQELGNPQYFTSTVTFSIMQSCIAFLLRTTEIYLSCLKFLALKLKIYFPFHWFAVCGDFFPTRKAARLKYLVINAQSHPFQSTSSLILIFIRIRQLSYIHYAYVLQTHIIHILVQAYKTLKIRKSL